MSQYLVLSHIAVQNANSIAGLTWGFPAITHFLGFTHALNRQFSNRYKGSYHSELSGCAVISHTVQNKVYQPKPYADFEFLQSKNPPVLAEHKSSSPPIIAEGKMNLTVSLILELSQPLALTTEEVTQLKKKIRSWCYSMRLAGGIILSIKDVRLLSASTQEQNLILLRKIKRLTMPGFVLVDRSYYLKEHYHALTAEHHASKKAVEPPQLIDAWLDFAVLKRQAIARELKHQSAPDSNTPADWYYVAKPKSGYLVPLMTGYKAISSLHEPGAVLNTRDEITPSCYVEAVHSIGEWKGMHGIGRVQEIIWRYEQNGPWYLCKQRHELESS